MVYQKLLVVMIIAVFGLQIFTGCVPGENSEEITQLQSVEIKEYEGVQLSSIADFRENSILGPQSIDRESYKLLIDGLVENPAIYSYDDVINDNESYKKVVTLHCVEGWTTTILWEGIIVKELLEKAIPRDNAKTIIFHAYDGYTTSFPVNYIMDNEILLAYKLNDVTLPAERGFPFQLVAESKWGYKWIKWVTRIELSDDINYRGYWESRGFSNSADLDKEYLA
jgi:DMSO/TMAO reductase YedYZ molybdopterin-dependent catalytic subunit